MPPLQPQRGKLLLDVGALLQLGHKVHFFNDLPGGNVCFAHALFADARHKAIVLVQRVVDNIALFYTFVNRISAVAASSIKAASNSAAVMASSLM